MADSRTVSDILKTVLELYSLNDGDINKIVSEIHIDKISRSCSYRWKSLLVRLDLKAIDVEDISRTLNNEQEKRSESLRTWMHLNGSDATYKWLITAQVANGSRKEAEFVCELLQNELRHSDHEQIDTRVQKVAQQGPAASIIQPTTELSMQSGVQEGCSFSAPAVTQQGPAASITQPTAGNQEGSSISQQSVAPEVTQLGPATTQPTTEHPHKVKSRPTSFKRSFNYWIFFSIVLVLSTGLSVIFTWIYFRIYDVSENNFSLIAAILSTFALCGCFGGVCFFVFCRKKLHILKMEMREDIVCFYGVIFIIIFIVLSFGIFQIISGSLIARSLVLNTEVNVRVFAGVVAVFDFLGAVCGFISGFLMCDTFCWKYKCHSRS